MTTSDETQGPLVRDARNEANAYLHVFREQSANMVPLALDCELIVGRAEELVLRVDDPSVSRQHAKIIARGGHATVIDLGSRNGTLLNGVAITGSHPLHSGDTIEIGPATLIYHCAPAMTRRRALADLAQLRLRLEEELDRAQRYERPLAIVAVSLVANDLLRADIVALLQPLTRILDIVTLHETELLIVLPEIAAAAAADTARRYLDAFASIAPDAKAGYSTYPIDGADVDSLLHGARQAAQQAQRQTVAAIAESKTILDLGDHGEVLVADPAMVRVYELLRKLAMSELPVLLLGETGVGKDVAATAVHHFSKRHQARMLAINCAALPDALLESELFGHEKGAFTGANLTKVGLLESAPGGTIFLDEVGELSASAQAKLLRVIESKRLSRVGDNRDRSVDIRILAATHKQLDEEVKAGRFRQDLYFRLSAATVVVPPLRDRPRELTGLATMFLRAACVKAERVERELSDGALQTLLRMPWPGNIRELRNMMEYLAVTAHNEVIESSDLPPSPGAPLDVVNKVVATVSSEGFRRLADEIADLERTRMREALAASGGVQNRAAELIGMPLRTFAAKLKQYGLRVPRG